MKNEKLTWFIFILLGFIILILNNPINLKFINNFIKEIKELLKKRNKYIEDGDYKLIHK